MRPRSTSENRPTVDVSKPANGPLPLFEEIHGKVVVAFRKFSPLGIRNDIAFEAAHPTAHTLTCLRFAGRVTETVARLATGSGGLTPGRAGFAPAGRRTKFHGVIASSIPLRPAVPGRTEIPICFSAARTRARQRE